MNGYRRKGEEKRKKLYIHIYIQKKGRGRRGNNADKTEKNKGREREPSCLRQRLAGTKKKKLQQKTEKPKFKTQNQSKNPLLFFCCYCSCCSFLFVACSVERFFSFPFFPLCVNGKGRDKYFPSHDLPVSVSLIICGGRNERTDEQHNTTQQSGWQFGVSAMYHEL